MKYWFAALVLLAGSATANAVAPEPPKPTDTLIINWLSDLDEARTKAHGAGKDLLVAFMISDANDWSQRLDAEIFSRPSFANKVNKRFVCVQVDFPKTYSLPDAQRRKNTALAKNWGVRSPPTLVLADSRGRPYAITGYRHIGATDYAHHLIALATIREQRDQYLAAAADASGTARAALLSNALRPIDEDLLLRHYAEELAELKKLDPENTTGLIGDIEFAPKFNALRERVLRLIRQKKDYAGALAAVDTFIEQSKPQGEHLQKTLFLKLPAYANNEQHNHAEILQLMNSIIAINPSSEQGTMAVDVRSRANALLENERRAMEAGETPPPARTPP